MTGSGDAVTQDTKHVPKYRPPVLVPEEYNLWAIRMEDYLYALDKEVWHSVEKGPYKNHASLNEARRSIGPTATNVVQEQKRRTEIDLLAIRELRNGIPNSIFMFVENLTSAKEIWDKLKDMFEGNEHQKTTKLTGLLTEFKDFKQKESESLDKVFERYTLLIGRLRRLKVDKSQQEINITFLQCLRKEWRIFFVYDQT